MLDLEIYRGDTETRTVTVKEGGAAFDLTGYTLKLIAKLNYGELDLAAVINKAIAVSAPLTGIGVLSLLHADTDISPGTYFYEIKLYNSTGTVIRTWGGGKLIIKHAVLLDVS